MYYISSTIYKGQLFFTRLTNKHTILISSLDHCPRLQTSQAITCSKQDFDLGKIQNIRSDVAGWISAIADSSNHYAIPFIDTIYS